MKAFLIWQMKWGDSLEFLVGRSLKNRKLLPSLQNIPTLPEGGQFIWDLFVILSTARPRAVETRGDKSFVVPSAILVSEILSLTDAAGVVDVEQRFRVVRIISAMDAAYREKTVSGV